LDEKKILQSWKEIASYLGRAERTCRRWEKDFGLPVHRMDGSPRASVFAYKEELDRWLDKLLHEKEISSKKSFFFPKKRWVILLSISILFISILTVVAWKILSPERDVPSSYVIPSLAVLYFRNGTGDATLDHWKETLCDYFITDLSQSKYIRVLDFPQIVSILEKHNLLESTRYSAEDLKSVAASGRASHILTGSFSKAGDESFRIDYSLHSLAERDEVVSDCVEGKGEDSIFSMVDELTIRVKNHLKLSEQQIASDYDKDFGEITTRSQEAYRHYKEGRNLFGKHHFMESISLMEKAISIDPDFAMAYRSIGVAYRNIYETRGGRGNLEKEYEYLKKAREIAETSDRITYKEKLIIQGCFFSRVGGDYQKAGEIFEKLAAEFPEDQAANSMMGWHSIRARDWDRVIKHYGLVVKYGTEIRFIYRQLGDAFCAKGMYEKAREVYRKYISDVSDDSIMRENITYSYVYEGKYKEALEEADKVIALDPNILTKGPIYHLQGNFDEAEKDYKARLQRGSSNWKLNGRRYLEYLYRRQGQYEKAKKEAEAGLSYVKNFTGMGWKGVFCDLLAEYDLAKGDLDSVLEKAEFIWERAVKGERTDWQTNALRLKIRVHLEQNDIEKSLALAEEVKSILETTPNAIDDRWHLDCLGLIEMKRGNYPKAIDLFTQVYEMQGGQWGWLEDHAYILNNLASAYYFNGNLEKAKKEYENIHTLTTGRFKDGDLYVKSFYMLGKIHEQQGNTIKAIESYRKFLDLWKDADPGIAEVEDAKLRLIALKG
jgi:tetratricopeptide (TPR) repeat protein